MEPSETAGGPQAASEVADAPGLHSRAATGGQFARRIALAYAGMIIYALLAATARPMTLPAAFAVLLPGSGLLWWGARRVPHRMVHAGWATLLTWVALGLLFCAWELVAYFSGNNPAHPTFSILADPLLDTYPGRVAGYLLWLATGAWLVTR
jgi:hypothetical protein